MRTEFSKNITDKRVTVQDGTFDRTGIDDGWADMIVVAQVRIIMFSLRVIIN